MRTQTQSLIQLLSHIFHIFVITNKSNYQDIKYDILMNSNFQWQIIKRFSAEDHLCFSIERVYREFPERDKNYIAQVLSLMAKRGHLIRLKKGLYYIVPLNQDSQNFIPDWHLVAKCLMGNRNYYIGYYSAMQIHGLITQPSLTEIIVTDVQVKPAVQEIQGVKFQYVFHKKKRFFGFTDTWIDNYNKVKCSDLEKTLVDSLMIPHYSGGIVEIGKAIYESRKKINLKLQFDYFIRAESKAAIKRYLFLCRHLDIWSVYQEGLMGKIGSSITVLDTSLPNEGKIDKEFGLKVNRDMETVINSIFT